mgnify:CR=1 FL=1
MTNPSAVPPFPAKFERSAPLGSLQRSGKSSAKERAAITSTKNSFNIITIMAPKYTIHCTQLIIKNTRSQQEVLKKLKENRKFSSPKKHEIQGSGKDLGIWDESFRPISFHLFFFTLSSLLLHKIIIDESKEENSIQNLISQPRHIDRVACPLCSWPVVGPVHEHVSTPLQLNPIIVR